MTDHMIKSYEEELNRLNGMITARGGLAAEQLEAVIDAAEHSDPDLASRVIEREPEADRLAHEVEALVIWVLALRQPMAIDLRQVLAALKIAAELERICDHAKDLAQRLIALSAAGVEPLPSLMALARFAAEMVDDTMQAYARMDAGEARAVWNRDTELDAKYTALFREVLTYMLEDPRRIAANTQSCSWPGPSSGSVTRQPTSRKLSFTWFAACPSRKNARRLMRPSR